MGTKSKERNQPVRQRSDIRLGAESGDVGEETSQSTSPCAGPLELEVTVTRTTAGNLVIARRQNAFILVDQSLREIGRVIGGDVGRLGSCMRNGFRFAATVDSVTPGEVRMTFHGQQTSASN